MPDSRESDSRGFWILVLMFASCNHCHSIHDTEDKVQELESRIIRLESSNNHN